MKRGDVVLMIAPRELGKLRPAVIIQTDALGSDTTTVLVCPLTSDLTDKLPIRPFVEPDLKNGLRIRSQVMTDKLAAVKRDRIRTLLGTLDSGTIEHIDRALMIVLGLAR